MLSAGLTVLTMSETNLWQWQFGATEEEQRESLLKTPIRFSEIDGWLDDNHADAFQAFNKSSEKLFRLSGREPRLKALCEKAASLGLTPSNAEAKHFFEANFSAHLITRPAKGAMVTGYFEPELPGSLRPDDVFNIPVYALPDDLILLTNGTSRQGLAADLTAARKSDGRLIPYFTRQEIEEGALGGRGFEIAYLADVAEAFIMQVQGSGAIRLQNGDVLRVNFAGKNGHPYTSIGKLLIERGELEPENASLDGLLDWLRANSGRGRLLMWENRSYPFFRVLSDAEASNGPYGSMGASLTPGRSLAVDPRYHQLGLPIWVAADELKDENEHSFKRLMIAQDTGSAIRGSVRGDIFWGSGAGAGNIAGKTKHICDFYILIPN